MRGGFLRPLAGISSDEETMAFIREERRTEIMPVLESTDKIAPRSVLRHRPIAGDGAEPGKNPAITPGTVPPVQRASRLRTRTEDTSVDVDEWQRTADDPAASAPTPAQTPLRRASTTGASRALPKAPLPKAKPSLSWGRPAERLSQPRRSSCNQRATTELRLPRRLG